MQSHALPTLVAFDDVGSIGLSVGKGKMVFSLYEAKGNIWMTKYPE